jgi:hypothetical protein
MRVSLAATRRSSCAFVVAFSLVLPLAGMVSGFVFHLCACSGGLQSGLNCIASHQERIFFHFKTEARCARQKYCIHAVTSLDLDHWAYESPKLQRRPSVLDPVIKWQSFLMIKICTLRPMEIILFIWNENLPFSVTLTDFRLTLWLSFLVWILEEMLLFLFA